MPPARRRPPAARDNPAAAAARHDLAAPGARDHPAAAAARRGLAGAALAALAFAGCGSTPVSELPPPAGPLRSPALVEAPAGRVVRGAVPGAVATRATGLGGRVFVARPDGRLEAVERGRVRASVRTGRAPVAVAVLGSGHRVAVLCGQERVLEVYDAATLRRLGRAPAGTGPTRVASDGHGRLYVTDTVAGALLVFHLQPRFELIRRVPLAGGPYAIAYDTGRMALWITLTGTNRVVRYAAGSRPVPRGSFPSVRQPDAVAVDAVLGRVLVSGRAGVLQVLERDRIR